MDKFVAGVSGRTKGLGLALKQVQPRENCSFGAAARHKINLFQSAFRIQLLLNLRNDFFYRLIHDTFLPLFSCFIGKAASVSALAHRYKCFPLSKRAVNQAGFGGKFRRMF